GGGELHARCPGPPARFPGRRGPRQGRASRARGARRRAEGVHPGFSRAARGTAGRSGQDGGGEVTGSTLLLIVTRHPISWCALPSFPPSPCRSSIVWSPTGLTPYSRRERREPAQPPPLDVHPPVTVLIPTYCEERVIAQTLEWASRIDYPDFEI